MPLPTPPHSRDKSPGFQGRKGWPPALKKDWEEMILAIRQDVWSVAKEKMNTLDWTSLLSNPTLFKGEGDNGPWGILLKEIAQVCEKREHECVHEDGQRILGVQDTFATGIVRGGWREEILKSESPSCGNRDAIFRLELSVFAKEGWWIRSPLPKKLIMDCATWWHHEKLRILSEFGVIPQSLNEKECTKMIELWLGKSLNGLSSELDERSRKAIANPPHQSLEVAALTSLIEQGWSTPERLADSLAQLPVWAPWVRGARLAIVALEQHGEILARSPQWESLLNAIERRANEAMATPTAAPGSYNERKGIIPGGNEWTQALGLAQRLELRKTLASPAGTEPPPYKATRL